MIGFVIGCYCAGVVGERLWLGVYDCGRECEPTKLKTESHT